MLQMLVFCDNISITKYIFKEVAMSNAFFYVFMFVFWAAIIVAVAVAFWKNASIHTFLKWLNGKTNLRYTTNFKKIKLILIGAVLLFATLINLCIFALGLSIKPERIDVIDLKEAKISAANINFCMQDDEQYYIENVTLWGVLPQTTIEYISGRVSAEYGLLFLVSFQLPNGDNIYTLMKTGKSDSSIISRYAEFDQNKKNGAEEIVINGRFSIKRHEITENQQAGYNEIVGSNTKNKKLVGMTLYYEKEYADFDACVTGVKDEYLGNIFAHIIICFCSIASFVGLILWILAVLLFKKSDSVGKGMFKGVALDRAEEYGISKSSTSMKNDEIVKKKRILRDFGFEQYKDGYFKTCYLRRTNLGYRAFVAVTDFQIKPTLSEKRIKTLLDNVNAPFIMIDRVLTEKELEHVQALANIIENSDYGVNNEYIFCYQNWGYKVSTKLETKWEPLANDLFGMMVYGGEFTIE